MNIFEYVTYEEWYGKFKANMISSVIALLIMIMVPYFICNSTADPLEDAVVEYTNATGIKIYPYGIECLKKEGAKRGLETKDEYLILIKENEKWLK